MKKNPGFVANSKRSDYKVIKIIIKKTTDYKILYDFKTIIKCSKSEMSKREMVKRQALNRLFWEGHILLQDILQ